MRFLARSLVALLAVFVALTARADEIADLHAAQQVLDATPAFRITVVGSSSMTPGKNHATFEFVRPNFVHAKLETEGTPACEVYTDGKKTVASEQGGAYKDASPSLATEVGWALDQSSIDPESGHGLALTVRHLTFSGHETVNGVLSSCYKGEDDGLGTGPMAGMHSSTKIWVSDQDHRPVRVEWSLHGMQKMDPQDEAKPFSQEMQVNYDYDPSIKFSMPVAG